MTSSDPAPRPPAKQRGNPSLGDMIRSMVVLVALVLGLALGGRALFGSSGDPVDSVDYRTTVEQVREAAPVEILAPRSLPDGWRATTTKYEAGPEGRWHLGVLTDDEEYVGLEQTRAGLRATVEQFAPETEPAGKSTIQGDTWRVRTSRDGETTFVRRSGQITTLVTGTAGRDEIKAYIASLSTE